MSSPVGRWPHGSLLASLSASEQQELVGLGLVRTLERGSFLIHEHATDRTAYLLLRGGLTVLTTTAAGDRSLVAVRLEGEMVGELAALDGRPRSASVIAATRVTVRAIGHDQLDRYLATRPSVREAIHRSVGLKLRQATRLRGDIAATSVLTRLVRVLVALGERHGEVTEQGVLLRIRLTQPDLADLIGSGEASVQRAFRELRENGLVRTGNRQILLRDPERLMAWGTG